MRQVLYDKKQKRYIVYDKDESVKCHSCKIIIAEDCPVIIHRSYNSKRQIIRKEYYCPNCINKHTKYFNDTYLLCEVKKSFNKDCIIISDELYLQDSYNIDESCCEIIDNTKLSGRESIQGANIGADIKEQLENKDKPINEKEAFKELDNMFKSVPVIEEKQKKKLNHSPDFNYSSGKKERDNSRQT